MKELSIYILEKLHISKNMKTKNNSINEKDFDYLYTGLTIGDFFKWSYSADIDDTDDVNFGDLFESSDILQKYFDDPNIQSCDDLETKKLDEVRDLFIKYQDEEITLYQKHIQEDKFMFSFIVPFIDEPILIEHYYQYTGKCNTKFEI